MKKYSKLQTKSWIWKYIYLENKTKYQKPPTYFCNKVGIKWQIRYFLCRPGPRPTNKFNTLQELILMSWNFYENEEMWLIITDCTLVDPFFPIMNEDKWPSSSFLVLLWPSKLDIDWGLYSLFNRLGHLWHRGVGGGRW